MGGVSSFYSLIIMNIIYSLVTGIRVGKNKKRVLGIIALHWRGLSFSESHVPPHFGHLVWRAKEQRLGMIDKTTEDTSGFSL